jgi:cellulose synthase/poly-beta-1,6-N-acetylglucosamine synthase-like glycosyltransferase
MFQRIRSPLTERILARLEDAEWREPNPHFQDDYRIAWITVLRASRGELLAHVSASYTVLGLHPEKVWPAIQQRRRAMLGQLFVSEDFCGTEALPKKPPRSAAVPIRVRAA